MSGYSLLGRAYKSRAHPQYNWGQIIIVAEWCCLFFCAIKTLFQAGGSWCLKGNRTPPGFPTIPHHLYSQVPLFPPPPHTLLWFLCPHSSNLFTIQPKHSFNSSTLKHDYGISTLSVICSLNVIGCFCIIWLQGWMKHLCLYEICLWLVNYVHVMTVIS